MVTKLLKIVPSTNKQKKFDAHFEISSKKKKVSFGSKGASDFTIHKDIERKKRYLDRHRKRENWNDPVTAGSLSRHILWSKTTLKESTKDFKKKFGL